MTIQDDELWEKLRKSWLQKPEAALDSEAFVFAVMERLPEPNLMPLGLWWKIPSLALGTALVLFFSVPSEEAPSSVEDLLVSTHPEAHSVLHPTDESTDLLTLSTEDEAI